MLSLGAAHSLMLKQDGSLWAAGFDLFGQLGIGSQKDTRSTFVQVISGGVEAVAAGGGHSILVKQDGSAWATGRNKYGQLGDGSYTDRSSYVQVALASSGVKTVAASSSHSLMLQQDGSVWSTGYNLYGQLGDGSTTSRTIFVQVMSSGAQSMAAGSMHSMVLKQDGSSKNMCKATSKPWLQACSTAW